MNYNHIRRKFDNGGAITADKKAAAIAKYRQNHASELTGMENDDTIWNMLLNNPIDDSEPSREESISDVNDKIASLTNDPVVFSPSNSTNSTLKDTITSNFTNLRDNIKANPASYITAASIIGIKGATNALVGDKNFDATSSAMDDAADQISGIASQFGPWGKAVAVGVQALNAADKMAGSTVPGYKVDMKSSGFGGVNSETKDASLRLTQAGNLDKMLNRRNQQAQMALSASQLDQDNNFMQEARMNSISDTVNRNQMALAGGYGTSTLGA